MNPLESLEHDKWMQRCIKLAANSKGTTAPNPMVGAVVVYEGGIIGEGFHIAYGQPHAEPQAIDAVCDKKLLTKATLYVNLEPCNHHGKTPPCTEKVIESGIKKVVVGALDPNHRVAGSGIKKLVSAGIDVQIGIEKDACEYLNRHFYKFHTKKQPFITMKWAESADGFMDNRQYKQQFPSVTKAAKISTPETDVWVHKLRAEHQSILVGYKTVIMDNPKLDVRLVNGKSPIVFLIDPDLKLTDKAEILSSGRQVVIFNNKKNGRENNKLFVLIKKDVFHTLQEYCCVNHIQSILVEGGLSVHNSFLANNYWDEIIRIKGQTKLQKGLLAPELPKNILHINTLHINNDEIDYIQKKNLQKY